MLHMQWFVAGSVQTAESFVAIVPLFVQLSSSHHRITQHTTSFYTYICTYYMYMNVAKCAFSLLFAGVLMHIVNVSIFTLTQLQC